MQAPDNQFRKILLELNSDIIHLQSFGLKKGKIALLGAIKISIEALTLSCTLKIVIHPKYVKHLTGYGHPESPNRYSAIIQALKQQGLLTEKNALLADFAPLKDMLLCHTPSYIKKVAQEALEGKTSLSTGDVVLCKDSFSIALLAAGGALKAVDALFLSETKKAFCCLRPPGHHASASQGMGFCIFNNAAIAARYAKKKYGVKKVAIIDWDVHHGNGTQEIFWQDPSVGYFSTHQLGLYPGTGASDEIGAGNIVNCPIRGGWQSKAQVLKAFEEQLWPFIERFRPQFLIISAGFDAHFQDPLGGFNLDERAFKQLTCLVKTIANTYCQGKLLSILEGGYHLQALSKSAAAHVEELML